MTESICHECGHTVVPEYKHHCPAINKVIIYCGFCDEKILDFRLSPKYKYPELPSGIAGQFICDDCERKANHYLHDPRSL